MKEQKITKITKKQKITIVVCLIIMIIIPILMYRENQKLVSTHPEYSTQGVSDKNRTNAETLLNSILSTDRSSIKKASTDESIYTFNSLESDYLFADLSSEDKLIITMNNTEKENVKTIPTSITKYFGSSQSSFYKVDSTSVSTTYKNMFGEELTSYDNLANYIYDKSTNAYYGYDYKNYSNSKTYYIYYSNYNVPYEHPDLATVNVSIISVSRESNDYNLYKVENIFGETIKANLTKTQIDEYVIDTNNYTDLNSYEITFKFDNDSTYGLTFSKAKAN